MYKKILEKHIAPYELNLENGGDNSTYPEWFFTNYAEFYVPYMIRKVKEFGKNFGDCNILDIGCGGAPFAGAILLYSQVNSYSGTYTGLDIRGELIDWLSEHYKEYGFMKFKKVIADMDVDYLGAHQSGQRTTVSSRGEEGRLDVQKNFYDLQWSSSVFTHLTPESCKSMLESIVASSKKDAIHFNTWLIIDDESRYALHAGIADRRLGFDYGEFLTYSEKNPLLCTAYKEEYIFAYYEELGLEIVDIQKGSWRGPIYSNEALHYQDIIISRVK